MGRSEYTVREHCCHGGRIEAERDEQGRWRIPRHEVELPPQRPKTLIVGALSLHRLRSRIRSRKHPTIGEVTIKRGRKILASAAQQKNWPSRIRT